MRIGIITLNGYHNFGNKLQNYSLEQVLLELGFEVETLFQRAGDYYSPDNKTSFYNLYTNLKKQKSNISKKEIFEYIYQKSNEASNKKIRIEQFINFKMFSEKYLNEVDYIISGNEMKLEIESRYDYFIVGSDQVWNPVWMIENWRNCLLGFTSYEKKLTYAPSFGVSELSDAEKNFFREHLKDFKSLSVREFAGAEIMKDLIGIDVPVVLDPTLLLTKEDWLKISSEHENKPSKPYILTYILGEYTKEMLEDINSLKVKYDLEVVNLMDLKVSQFYSTNPSEFLDFIQDCTIFLTDSFHGVVFANILEKYYVVYNRIDKNRSMNSRIETLNKLFSIENNFRTKMENVSLKEIDFTNFKTKLKSFKLESFEFIKGMLKN